MDKSFKLNPSNLHGYIMNCNTILLIEKIYREKLIILNKFNKYLRLK